MDTSAGVDGAHYSRSGDRRYMVCMENGATSPSFQNHVVLVLTKTVSGESDCGACLYLRLAALQVPAEHLIHHMLYVGEEEAVGRLGHGNLGP